ncbi:MAG: MFS transporter [Anaerolineales bacterium]|nr:MFS transporter [Anaerolineales bacterium]
MTLILDALFSSVAFGHLIVDAINGTRAVLLAYLSGPLGLSNTVLGFVSTAYIVSAALIQPLFGYLADKFSSRWVVAGGILWMGVFFSLALFIPGNVALGFLVLASLGSGAFHPAGTMQATLSGRNHFSGRETTATAYFFVFGQVGLFVGPLAGGPLLDRFGPAGLLVFTALAVPIGLNTIRQLRPGLELRVTQTIQKTKQTARQGRRRRVAPFLFAFAIMVFFQAWVQQNMITFLPKYLSDMGQSAAFYGILSATFMGGSALGNIVGGSLADRFGKRRVASAALILAGIPLFLIAEVGLSWWLFLLVPLAGGLTGSVHSIFVVLAQRHIPAGMALASGLILGYIFTSGALGTLLAGYLADIWGLLPVFRMNSFLVVAAAILALTLQKEE